MRESRQLEFKEKINNYQALNKELVGLLNDIGGELLIGVKDDGTPLGLSENLIDKYLEELPSSIFNSITPYCHPDISVKNLNGLQVISIKVHSSNKRPYFLKSKGIPDGVYIRVGTHTMPATEEIIEDLQRSNGKESFDETLVNTAQLEDFDSMVLHAHYSGVPSEEQLMADKVIRFDSLTKKLTPTIAGVLFFHKHPCKVIEGAEVLFSHFEGEDMGKILKTKDYCGPLLPLINEVLRDLKNELATSLERKQSQLKQGNLLISEVALREALVNALIHRKYYLSDTVKIALFSNRLEIFGPGNFPGPITDYRAGISYSRNPALRQLARNIGLVEKRGLGLPLIFSECEKNANPKPEIIEQVGDFVKLIIYFPMSPKVTRGEKDGTEDLLAPFREQKSFTLTQVAKQWACSKNTASSRLQPYLKRGEVEKKGQGRGTYYQWIR